jgi:hypothetical protein
MDTIDLDAAIGTPRKTRAKLDYTLQAYGRLEIRIAEVRRERERYRAALEQIAQSVDGEHRMGRLETARLAKAALSKPSGA